MKHVTSVNGYYESLAQSSKTLSATVPNNSFSAGGSNASSASSSPSHVAASLLANGKRIMRKGKSTWSLKHFSV